MERKKSNRLLFAVALALTLGLAPFIPEPHILSKVRWVMGGAKGMQPIDYFDLVLHGTPWVYLGYQLVVNALRVLSRRRRRYTQIFIPDS